MLTIDLNSSLLSRLNFVIGRSPVYSHVNATLQGSSTVRAFNASKMLEAEFHEFQDHNTSCAFLFSCASRWFSQWMDVVCILYVAFVTYSFLVLEDCKSICAMIIFFINFFINTFINTFLHHNSQFSIQKVHLHWEKNLVHSSDWNAKWKSWSSDFEHV